MKLNQYLVIGLTVLVIIGVVLLVSYSQKDNSNKCKEGFIFEKQDENNFWCKSPEKNFECSDTIKSSKGFYVCGHMIDNVHVIPNVSYDDFNKIVKENKTVQVKGKIHQWYILCTGKEVDYMRQALCGYVYNEIRIEQLTSSQ